MLASLVSVRERRVSKQSRVCVCVVEMFGPDLLTAHWSSSSRSEPSRGGGTCCTADLPLVYCKYHTRVGSEGEDIQYTFSLYHDAMYTG